MTTGLILHLSLVAVLAALGYVGIEAIFRGEPLHLAYMRFVPGLEAWTRRALLRHADRLEADAAKEYAWAKAMAEQIRQREGR